MDRVLELLPEGASADLIEEKAHSCVVRYESNKLTSAGTKEASGIGLRVIYNGRMGYSSINNPQNMDFLVQSALMCSKLGEEVDFELPGPAVYPKMNIYNPDVEKLTSRELKGIGDRIVEGVRSEFSDVSVNMRLRSSVCTRRLVNTSGVDVQDKSTLVDVSVECSTMREESIIVVWKIPTSRTLEGLEVDRVVEDIKTLLRWSEREVKLPFNKADVLFSPDMMAYILLQPIALALSGDNLWRGISKFCGKMDELVFDERITIDDDPFIDEANAFPFDGEGVPVKKRSVIDRGVVKGYCLDVYSADKLGMQTTGNAHREYDSKVSAGAHGLVMSGVEGGGGVLDIISEMKQGIVVCSVLGGGQSNTLAGDISVAISLGFLVENGEVVGRIKDTMIAGNVFELFKERVGVIGENPEGVFGYRMPPLVLKDIPLASR